MTDLIHAKIEQSLREVGSLYHHLVLLVGKPGSGKTSVLREVAKRFDTEVININLALSVELLELTSKQRALRLPRILDKVLDTVQSLVVLDNIEILFDKDLKQDPLRLLQGISRNRSVVASWIGTTTGRKLNYAEAGHPEYRSYDLADLTVVSMDETATVDSARNNIEAGQA